VTESGPRIFGDIEDTSLPLAVLVHGFPDTPHTWRHLGPELVQHGYRVVAPWLPGYDSPVGKPISVGTYARAILDVRHRHRAERAVLIGHDWGAIGGYAAVAFEPEAFSHFVALAVPPTVALATGIFTYPQLKRSFYIWFIQQVGLAEAVVTGPGFFESLWADWSPGYDASEDVAELRRYVTPDNIADVIAPYRASFNTSPEFTDPDAQAEAAASMQPPPVPTLYLHGAADGALGAEILADVETHLPAAGSVFEIVNDVGHFLHLEQPELIAAKITGWLAG
jgi:pimeloyl-ACP methyl ester carboxylesterase